MLLVKPILDLLVLELNMMLHLEQLLPCLFQAMPFHIELVLQLDFQGLLLSDLFDFPLFFDFTFHLAIQVIILNHH